MGEDIALIAVHPVIKFSPEHSPDLGVLVAAPLFTGIPLQELWP
jgi:hypothetical protein